MTAKTTKPRIITKTVRELQRVAAELQAIATALSDGADGRETQEKRRNRKSKRAA